VTHPDFGSYATLKCGIEYERQRIAWLRWVIGEFTSQQPAASSQQPAASRGKHPPGRNGVY
jgi:hypothetical protein